MFIHEVSCATLFTSTHVAGGGKNEKKPCNQDKAILIVLLDNADRSLIFDNLTTYLDLCQLHQGSSAFQRYSRSSTK